MLSEDLIVETALTILRAEGLDAVTMRRVATELDTGPASLYVYIRGREQLHALVAALLRALEAHPGVAAVAVRDPPTTERGLLVADYMLGVLIAGGITPPGRRLGMRHPAAADDRLGDGTAVHMTRGNTPGATVERLDAVFSALPADRFPNIATYGDVLTSGDGSERFRFAIDVFLDGLVARAARS